MPLLSNGIYVDDGDKAYELETSYYLNFQINSALISLQYLQSKPDETLFRDKYQYYHYYSDHLLFSWGQITNRFIDNNKDCLLIKDRKKSNRSNYQFSETRFPILSNKCPRNVIEHIDERDYKTVEKKNGVGGFNVIDRDDASELAGILKLRRDVNPYILDLISWEILIRDKEDDITICLNDLKNELLILQKNVDQFLELMFAS